MGQRHFSRREVLIGMAASALPPAVRAAGGRPRLGVLWLSVPERRAASLRALEEGLRGVGYVPRETIDIEERSADGDTTRLPALARELLQIKPTVIFAESPSPVVALHEIAPTIPVVCPALNDALVPRVIASYGHPGGSVTGLSTIVEGMYAKLVELARDMRPSLSRAGGLINPTSPDAPLSRREFAAARQATGVELTVAEAATSEELDTALDRLEAARIEALIVPPNSFLYASWPRLVAWQTKAGAGLISTPGAVIRSGGLAGYGADGIENTRRAAVYIARIIKGELPSDLPVEFPTKFTLMVNLKTAKTLGISVPPTMLVRADEVIE